MYIFVHCGCIPCTYHASWSFSKCYMYMYMNYNRIGHLHASLHTHAKDCDCTLVLCMLLKSTPKICSLGSVIGTLAISRIWIFLAMMLLYKWWGTFISYMTNNNCFINLHFEIQSMASCPPRFLSVNRARNLSVNGLQKMKTPRSHSSLTWITYTGRNYPNVNNINQWK